MTGAGPELGPQRRAREGELAAHLRDYVQTTNPFAIDHDVQITSYGGAGTTALTRHLLDAGLRLPKGPGQWPHKHQRIPPDADAVPAGFRVIYVVGDPRNAVLSIFRRKYQLSHYQWLRSMRADEAVAARLTDLETFLAGGVDEFGLADHLHRWLDHPPGYAVLFVRYEHLGDAWEGVRDYVGLPADHPGFEFSPRESAWEDLPPALRDPLESIYGELAREVAAMPPTQVR